ncbi:MAG: hypothetical protein WD063_21625 [Pirellulales bacterium]
MSWRASGIVGVFVLRLFGDAVAVTGAETIQHFPADKPAQQMDTQWRVIWGIERHAGMSEILFVKEAYFKRSKDEPELKVLNDCRLAEIFVPYNGGARIYDLSGHSFSLVTIDEQVLGPACVAPGAILARDGQPSESGLVAREVHDGHLRWMNAAERTRRGQSLSLWSVLDGSNYRYIMLYDFRDDGLVGFRLGATAHNLYSSDDDETTHLHLGCWRLHLALGDPRQTKFSVVRLDTEKATTVVETAAQERRIKWNPDEFTALRVESLVEKNSHAPPHAIGYELMPLRMGSARYSGVGEEFTLHDLWVTRPDAAERRPRDLGQYENGQALGSAGATIWHQVPVLHRARDEDFGRVGTNSGEGVAITAWAGLDLKPRNLFSKTPLYGP